MHRNDHPDRIFVSFELAKVDVHLGGGRLRLESGARACSRTAIDRDLTAGQTRRGMGLITGNATLAVATTAKRTRSVLLLIRRLLQELPVAASAGRSGP